MTWPTLHSVTFFSQSFHLQGKDKAESILGDAVTAGETRHWGWRQEQFGGFVPGSWDSSWAAPLQMDRKLRLPGNGSSQFINTTQWMPVRPALGPERAVHTRLLGAPLPSLTWQRARPKAGHASLPVAKHRPGETPLIWTWIKRRKIAKTKPTKRTAWPEWKRMLSGSLYKEDTSGKRETEWYFRKVERAFAKGRQRT